MQPLTIPRTSLTARYQTPSAHPVANQRFALLRSSAFSVQPASPNSSLITESIHARYIDRRLSTRDVPQWIANQRFAQLRPPLKGRPAVIAKPRFFCIHRRTVRADILQAKPALHGLTDPFLGRHTFDSCCHTRKPSVCSAEGEPCGSPRFHQILRALWKAHKDLIIISFFFHTSKQHIKRVMGVDPLIARYPHSVFFQAV